MVQLNSYPQEVPPELTARHRERNIRSSAPKVFDAFQGGLVDDGLMLWSTQVCDDWVATKGLPYKNSRKRFDGTTWPIPFEIVKDSINAPRVSGTTYNEFGDLIHKFSGRPLYYKSPFGPSTMSWEDLEADTSDGFLSKGLASGNPFTPEFSVPLAVVELLEAATLLRIDIQTFARAWGSGYLNLKFGWLQLQDDLRTLNGIVKAIKQRVVDIDRLFKDGGLRTYRKLGTKSLTEPQGEEITLSSDYNVGCNVKLQHTFTSRIWCTARWRPKSRGNLFPLNPLESIDRAVAQILDLEWLDESTLWNILPMSWMIDYFVNIGPAMEAFENEEQVEPYDICLMRERKVETSISSAGAVTGPDGQYTLSSGSSKKIIKLREVFHSRPEYESLLRFGWLNSNQALTLAALLARLSSPGRVRLRNDGKPVY